MYSLFLLDRHITLYQPPTPHRVANPDARIKHQTRALSDDRYARKSRPHLAPFLPCLLHLALFPHLLSRIESSDRYSLEARWLVQSVPVHSQMFVSLAMRIREWNDIRVRTFSLRCFPMECLFASSIVWCVITASHS